MSINIFVFGKVQGVFFRSNTLEKALSLGLTGFVRNLPDGSVEIRASGEKEKLQELLEWARKGPATADVKEVKYSWGKENFEKFEIRY